MQRSILFGLFAVAFAVSTPLAVQAPAAFAQKTSTKAKAPPAPRPTVRVAATPANCSTFYLNGRAPAPVAPTVPAGRVFCHMIYSVSYSVAMLNPLWSAEHLTHDAAIGGDSTFRGDRSSFQQQPGLTPRAAGRECRLCSQ